MLIRARIRRVGNNGPAAILADSMEQLDALAQTMQIEQRRSVWASEWGGAEVGPAQADGGVAAVRVADDEIRIRTAANAD